MLAEPQAASPGPEHAVLPIAGERGVCHRSDNLDVLGRLADASIDCIYIDPPFNTGAPRSMRRMSALRDASAPPRFGGHGYRVVPRGERIAYRDDSAEYAAWLEPRFTALRRVLRDHGTLYVHLDQREVHYVKVQLDGIFGRECFLNEVIWAYDFGGRGSRRWPAKHDTILVYARRAGAQWFDTAEVERLPYMAPGLVGAAKAARGKLPTDVWWHTIVPTNGRERTGYPTQKPVGVVRRALAASCPPQGVCLDVFAGSGTTGAAALELGRRFVLVDENEAALEVQRRRFADMPGVRFEPATGMRVAARPQ